MSTRAIVMPHFMIDLSQLALARLGLSVEAGGDMVQCPLLYEDGTELLFTVLHVAQRQWFGQERPMALVSLCQMGEDGSPVLVHLRELTAAPVGPNDFPFMVRLAAKVRGMAWAIAGTTQMGECLSLPGRPHSAQKGSSRGMG